MRSLLACTTIGVLVLQVLILGRSLEGEVDADLKPFVDSGQIAGRPPGTPWRDFLKVLQTAKSLFVPNIHDASPRWVSGAYSQKAHPTFSFFLSDHQAVIAAALTLRPIMKYRAGPMSDLFRSETPQTSFSLPSVKANLQKHWPPRSGCSSAEWWSRHCVWGCQSLWIGIY